MLLHLEGLLYIILSDVLVDSVIQLTFLKVKHIPQACNLNPYEQNFYPFHSRTVEQRHLWNKALSFSLEKLYPK